MDQPVYVSLYIVPLPRVGHDESPFMCVLSLEETSLGQRKYPMWGRKKDAQILPLTQAVQGAEQENLPPSVAPLSSCREEEL